MKKKSLLNLLLIPVLLILIAGFFFLRERFNVWGEAANVAETITSGQKKESGKTQDTIASKINAAPGQSEDSTLERHSESGGRLSREDQTLLSDVPSDSSGDNDTPLDHMAGKSGDNGLLLDSLPDKSGDNGVPPSWRLYSKKPDGGEPAVTSLNIAPKTVHLGGLTYNLSASGSGNPDWKKNDFLKEMSRNYVLASRFKTLNEAVDSANAVGKALLISDTTRLSGSVTVEVPTVFWPQGIIETTGAADTITFKRPIEALPLQLKRGPGKMHLSENSNAVIRPHWWGLKSLAETNPDTVESGAVLREVIESTDAGKIEIPPGTYLFKTPMLLKPRYHIEGHNVPINNGGGTVFRCWDGHNTPLLLTEYADGSLPSGTHFYSVKNIMFDGNWKTQTQVTDTALVDLSGSFITATVENIAVFDFYGRTGLRIAYADIPIRNVWINRGYVPKGKYAVRLGLDGGGGGMASVYEHIFVEHVVCRDTLEGEPWKVKSLRGDAMLIKGASSVELSNFHFEGAANAITIGNDVGVLKVTSGSSSGCDTVFNFHRLPQYAMNLGPVFLPVGDEAAIAIAKADNIADSLLIDTEDTPIFRIANVTYVGALAGSYHSGDQYVSNGNMIIGAHSDHITAGTGRNVLTIRKGLNPSYPVPGAFQLFADRNGEAVIKDGNGSNYVLTDATAEHGLRIGNHGSHLNQFSIVYENGWKLMIINNGADTSYVNIDARAAAQ